MLKQEQLILIEAKIFKEIVIKLKEVVSNMDQNLNNINKIKKYRAK